MYVILCEYIQKSYNIHYIYIHQRGGSFPDFSFIHHALSNIVMQFSREYSVMK